MFKLVNVYNSSNISTTVEHKGDVITFDISSLINKRNKDELDPDNQYKLLNAYLDYKGDGFKDKLFQHYLAADEKLIMLISKRNITPLPTELVYGIMDMLDLDDITMFVRDIYKVKPPIQLKESFDTRIEKDDEGTRAQTYIQQDYWELAALTTILKAVLPIIGQFGFYKSNYLMRANKHYTLFNFIVDHPVFESAPMRKLLEFIEKLVAISFKAKNTAAIRVIERRISENEMPVYLLSSAVFTKVAIATIVDDFAGKNIITRLHGYVQSKLNLRDDVQSAIRDKKSFIDAESGDGDKESYMESYKIESDVTPGTQVELDWSVSDIATIVSQLPVQVDIDMAYKTRDLLGKFDGLDISSQHITLLAYVFKDVIDPRAISYISKVSILNLQAVAFAYLWAIDCKYLAILIISVTDNMSDDNGMVLNITSNRTRLTTELKDELAIYFPYTRPINQTTSVNVAEEDINTLSSEIYSQRWEPIADIEYIKEVAGSRSEFKMLPPDIKTKITDMVIKLEKLRG